VFGMTMASVAVKLLCGMPARRQRSHDHHHDVGRV
jgi:hypothetical protein